MNLTTSALDVCLFWVGGLRKLKNMEDNGHSLSTWKTGGFFVAVYQTTRLVRC